MPKTYKTRQNRNANDRARATIQKRLPELLAALMQSALGGDIQAAKLLLDRVMPALKPEPATKPLAFLADGLSTEALTQAVARGELSPEQAHALASLLPEETGPQEIIIERRY